MIKKITFLFMMLPILGFGQLATWNFFGATEVPTWNATTINANLVQTAPLTRGSGAAESAGANSFRTVGFQNDGIAVTNNDYFQFQLAPLTGFEMSLSSIDGQVRGTNGYVTGGVQNQFAYSLDGTTFTLIGLPLSVTVNNSALPTTDLSGITALQNIAAGTTVTFRFYASGQTTTGGWGFTSASATTENLVVGGTSVAAGAPCPTLVAPTATGASICSNSSASLTATSAQTGSILKWYDVATGGSSLFTGSSFTTPVLSTTTSYWVQDSVSGCPAGPRTEVVVTISGTAPTVTAGSNSAICAGGTINLTANTVAGAVYGWTGPNSFTSAVQNPSIPSATALASGVYTLSITAGGCNAATGTVNVIVNALPTVNAGVDKSVCTGSSVTLAALGANTYTWSPATGLSSATGNTVTANPTATTTYTVSGTDANGCVGTDMVLVTVNPLPVVTITANGLSLTASLSGATYKWINCADDMAIAGATSQTYVATGNGSYKVEVTNSNGCVATSTCMNVTTVGVESKSDLNAFSLSPNPTKGKVTITASGNESANVVIFNALGKEITRSNNVQNGTQLDLSAVQNGVYMVQISTDKGTKVLRIVKN